MKRWPPIAPGAPALYSGGTRSAIGSSLHIEDLVGKPYAIGGRGPSAYDCAGLVIELQRRQGHLLHIPDTCDTKLGDHLAMRHILAAGWRELDAPRPGCIVFFPRDAHVGTMLDTRRFLHTTSLMGEAYIESFVSPFFRRLVHSFYEPAGAR